MHLSLTSFLLSGLSSTLETIAIYVGMEMEKESGDAFSLVDALEKFFRIMMDLRKTRIEFSQETFQSYTRGRAFYSKAEIWPQILSQTPLVLDPVDPFNNRLQGRNFDSDFFRTLSNKAELSLQILQKAKPPFAAKPELFSFVLKTLFPGPFSQDQFSSSPVHFMPRPTTITISMGTGR